MVKEMVSDFRKLFRFIFRLFTPSFWSSAYSWACSDEAASLGKKIVLVVFVLFLGLGALVLVAGVHQVGHARGGQALATPMPPPGEIKLPDRKEPEVRRALPVIPAVETLYMVSGVAKGDFLNVHVRASASSPVVARLPAGYHGVQIVGEPVMNDTTQWVQVRFDDHVGWVSRAYLKPEQVQAGGRSTTPPSAQIYKTPGVFIR